jgi:hypothetical protein
MPAVLQEDIAVKNPILAFGPFMDVDVAASQTDVQLLLCGTGSDSAVMPVAGWVIGISYTLTAAGSAGTLSVGATIDGTEVAATTLAVGTTTEGYVISGTAAASCRFAAGANIGAEITSDGSWNGTTSDLAVFVFVVLEDLAI